MKLPLDLQLNCFQPLVEKPARLLGEQTALRLASTLEVLEDYNCGCGSDFSTDPPSGSRRSLPHLRMLVVHPVFIWRSMALLVTALSSRAL